MKFLINIFGKKDVVQENNENIMTSNVNILNQLDTLHSHCQLAPNNKLKIVTNVDQMATSINSLVNNEAIINVTADSVLDINSNIMFKHRNSFEESSFTDSFDKSDNDDNSIKRNSIERSNSIPWGEDSGFSSSSNCLTDDKDDNSINNSFDNDDNDKCDSSQSFQPFSLSSVRRFRSYSVESTSSDISDTIAETNSKLSLSVLPSMHDSDINDDSDKLSTSDQTNPSNAGITKRKRSRRTSSKSTNVPRPLVVNRNDNDLNNNSINVTNKNLHSFLEKAIPFRFADIFQNHGLITLVACIWYTLFLVFFLGLTSLAWSLVRRCISKTELKDLRETLLESQRRREMTSISNMERREWHR